MPNLVGFRDGTPPLVEDQAKQNTLVAMQMEALGSRRRDFLSTTDFKENKASYVPTLHLESQRLVNKRSIGQGEKSKLEGWNNAWTRLQDDGTDTQNLRAVNEGLGQTHRARLMSDDSVRDYTGEENFCGGGRSGRGDRGDRGGRGGGNAGRTTGRGGRGKAKGERRVTFQDGSLVQPITRVRVPKGQPSAQIDVPRHQPHPILKTVSAVKSPKGNTTTPSTPATLTRPPVHYDGMLAAPSAFMASVGIRKERTRDEPNIKDAPSATDTSKEKVIGYKNDTLITKITDTSSEKAIAHKSNASAIDTPSHNTTTAAGKTIKGLDSRPKGDLMDLDTGRETTQPVLQFTAPSTKEPPSHHVDQVVLAFDQQIEALEKIGVFNATQLELLKSIQTQVHARKNATAPVKEAPRPGIYTKSELVSLRPTASVPEVTTGIAAKFAQQQHAFLIGEHVHKTRYHTAASLTEDFERLSVSDKRPAKPAATDLSISDKKPAKPAATDLSTPEKSNINPFGPPPVKGKGPSLPAHLLKQTTTADHGAAARAQYSGSNDILAPISDRQSLVDVTSTTRPTRRNMINQTGFIALAENRVNFVAAGKKGEDPLLVARKRGL